MGSGYTMIQFIGSFSFFFYTLIPIVIESEYMRNFTCIQSRRNTFAEHKNKLYFFSLPLLLLFFSLQFYTHTYYMYMEDTVNIS